MTTKALQSVRRIGRALLVAPLILVGETCTGLTETPHDALTPENAFKTETELLAGVAGVYAQMRAIEWVGYVTLQDITTDVSIVPTRGSDWYDNGRWLEMHRQTWSANSGSALDDMNGAWNNLFAGIAKANLMIDVVTKAGGPSAPSTIAELRTLRAWFYYMLQDMFGGAPPLVTTTELKRSPSSTREEIFNFMEAELTAALTDLPATRPASQYGRITRGAAHAMLASLYINAGVFKKNAVSATNPGFSTSSYNSCQGVTVVGIVTGNTSACQAAIDAANAVINSGLYSLAPNWSDNFDQDNHTSPENIFVIAYTAEGSQGLGGNWPFRTLHYNQLNSGWGSPWNGFATLAETYNQFTATDVRRSMWLVGPQRSFETGRLVTDRATNAGDTIANPLTFTPNIPDANQANEAHGVRFNKFPPIPSAITGNGMPNDFPFFRLSEIYLIKAEALNEQGSTNLARTELARVHDLRDPGTPVAGVTFTQTSMRDAILKERLLEFAGEGKRRTDLVRYGRYLDQWSTTMANGKTSQASKPHLVIFPVPVTQIGSNSLLVQNPGY